MTKSHITLDFDNKTLNLTKSFYNKACKVGSPEYKELRTAMSENPKGDIHLSQPDPFVLVLFAILAGHS